MRWLGGLCAIGLAAAAIWPVGSDAAVSSRAGSPTITIDGHRPGQVFDGVGAISGGGGMTRLLIDYPAAQRAQILNYLFGPGGASLQVLKMEIGGDAGQSDGAEPSVEHSKGQIDCQSGYEWWLAEQAVARDPHITLMGLQWSAPGWVGTVFSSADIGYIIEWLNCAKSHHLTVGYVGGWDENGFKIAWYEALRQALNSSGYRSVKIIAADSFPGPAYRWARTWQVANAAAEDPAFKAALSAIGVHDTCGGPTTGFVCQSTVTARKLGLPLWESELGTLHLSPAAANMARAINNGYIQADINGFIEWPLTAAAAPVLPYGDRGLLTANQPQSGWYSVNQITWAIAQTTQFTQPGWRHVLGAAGPIGKSGNYVAYEAPNRRDWSLVAENTGSHADQEVGTQTITVHLTGGLAATDIRVWETNLLAGDPAQWFYRRADIHPVRGTFTYALPSGYIASFTSTTGQAHARYQSPADKPMTLPYTATADASNEAWGLDAQEGAFLYEPCLDGATGQCIQQMAERKPVFWQSPTQGTPTPYAVVGAGDWANYTVSVSVLFSSASASAGLIGRFTQQATDPKLFDAYQFDLRGDGVWVLLLNGRGGAKVLAHGSVSGVVPGSWYPIALNLTGNQLTASVNGTAVARVTSSVYQSGLAGIESNWASVQFNGLSVSQP